MPMNKLLHINDNYSNQTIVLSKKRKIDNIFMYILAFLLIYWSVFVLSEYEPLDLGRYYEEVEMQAEVYSLSDIIKIRYYDMKKYDFIYHTILFVACKFFIPLNLITSVIVFTYYLLIVKMMRIFFGGKIDNFVILAVLLTTPITWVVEISRNLTAITLLYISVKYLYANKRIIAVLFIVASVLTHFGAALYVLVLFCSQILQNKHIKQNVVFFLLLVVSIISFIMPTSVLTIMRWFLEEDSGYTHYTMNTSASFFAATNIHYGDKLPAVFAVLFSIILLLLNKKQGFAFWCLLLFTMLLFFFLNLGVMFVNRLMMVVPLFWGINLAIIYKNARLADVQFLRTFSVIAWIPIVLHFYAYRPVYFPFFFS